MKYYVVHNTSSFHQYQNIVLSFLTLEKLCIFGLKNDKTNEKVQWIYRIMMMFIPMKQVI